MNARQRGAHVGFDQVHQGHEHLEEQNEEAESELGKFRFLIFCPSFVHV